MLYCQPLSLEGNRPADRVMLSPQTSLAPTTMLHTQALTDYLISEKGVFSTRLTPTIQKIFINWHNILEGNLAGPEKDQQLFYLYPSLC